MNASKMHGDRITGRLVRGWFSSHSSKTITNTLPLRSSCTIFCTPPKKNRFGWNSRSLQRWSLPNQWDTHPGISPNTQRMARPASLSGLFLQSKWMLSTQPSMNTRRAHVFTIQSATFHLVIWWPGKSLLPEQLSNTILCSVGLFYYHN